MGRILIITVALITMGTAAHATTLASGTLFGANMQIEAGCTLYNAGNFPVSISGA